MSERDVYVPCDSETVAEFGNVWQCTQRVGHEGSHRAYWRDGVAQLIWEDKE